MLSPLDESGDELGWFPCGRQETNFEAKEVRLPRDLSCDACIVEVLWKTEKGKQSFCSDIMVLGGAEVPECFGLCTHSGVCSNGKCVCSDMYYGSNCQYAHEKIEIKSSFQSVFSKMAPTSSQWVFYLFALIIIGGLFGLAAWLLKKANENAQKKKKDEDNRLG